MVAKRQRDGEELNWEFGISQVQTVMNRMDKHQGSILQHRKLYSVSYVVLVAQLCLTLCDPMGCSLPDSSLCGISQERKHNGKE